MESFTVTITNRTFCFETDEFKVEGNATYQDDNVTTVSGSMTAKLENEELKHIGTLYFDNQEQKEAVSFFDIPVDYIDTVNIIFTSLMQKLNNFKGSE